MDPVRDAKVSILAYSIQKLQREDYPLTAQEIGKALEPCIEAEEVELLLKEYGFMEGEPGAHDVTLKGALYGKQFFRQKNCQKIFFCQWKPAMLGLLKSKLYRREKNLVIQGQL